MQIDQAIELYTAKLMYSKFQSIEVASRYRDPQPQLVEKYSYLFNLGSENLQIFMFKHTFCSQ